jgi:hypothetical protein
LTLTGRRSCPRWLRSLPREKYQLLPSPLASHAASARFLGRPVALLFCNKWCLLITGTFTLATSPSSRAGHASSKSTASIEVSMSTRRGATPIWNTVPGVSKSRGSIWCSGAPKRLSASIMRDALFSLCGLLTHKSISPVALTCPCAASA